MIAIDHKGVEVAVVVQIAQGDPITVGTAQALTGINKDAQAVIQPDFVIGDVYNPQDFLDAIQTAKGGYDTSLAQGSSESLKNAMSEYGKAIKEDTENAPMGYLDADTKKVLAFLEKGGGTSEELSNVSSFLGADQMKTLLDSYNLDRKNREQSLKDQYKYGQGLTAPTEDIEE